jgi:hypothetical protein
MGKRSDYIFIENKYTAWYNDSVAKAIPRHIIENV